MKNSLKKSVLATALLAIVQTAAAAPPNSLVEFDPKEARSLGWRVVDDGVMGGRSKGGLEVTKDGILSFKGTLSLENNGGFSSIRTSRLKKDLSGAKGLVARVKGDGRTYEMRFNTNARFRGMEVSFKADFKTKKGEWTEVKIPFNNFTGSFRGMSLKKEQFDPSKIQRLGLLLADKKAGPFDLKVDWIRTYGADSNDLVSTALSDGRFGTLAKALTEDGLVETLQGKGPFTVFAPTDEAFAKLPKGTVASLLKPENKAKLQAILTYHVIDAVLLPSKDGEGAKKNSAQKELPPKMAMAKIEAAISKGVPTYNEGDPGKCSKIYRECMVAISKNCKVDQRVSKAIEELVKRADKIEDDSERAWVLRGGLDYLYSVLSSQ